MDFFKYVVTQTTTQQKTQKPPKKQAAVPATMDCQSEIAFFPRINPVPKRIVSPGKGIPIFFNNTTIKTNKYPKWEM